MASVMYPYVTYKIRDSTGYLTLVNLSIKLTRVIFNRRICVSPFTDYRVIASPIIGVLKDSFIVYLPRSIYLHIFISRHFDYSCHKSMLG